MTETNHLHPMPGDRINDFAELMIKTAGETGEITTGDFNDIPLSTKGKTAEQIIESYHQQSEARREAYLASPEYKARQVAAEEAGRVRQAALDVALAAAPETATFKDAAEWQALVEKNSGDGYSASTVGFAELWARLMEGQLAQGKTLEDVAQAMSTLADHKYGITGAMYGFAVGCLAHHWTHGEALRRWHNRTTQLGTEGDKANETGGVLNPAMLTIG